MRDSSNLIYGLEDKPPFKIALFAAFQHLLAIFVAIITPPLIISNALSFDSETTALLISSSLLVSGISTFIQCRRVGGIGAGLLCVQGTSYSFISPIITAGMAGGLPLIFGVSMAGAFVEMAMSRVIKYTQRVITPLVSGVVVTLIGLSLIKVGVISCGGGFSSMESGEFGSLENLGLAALVLFTIVLFNCSGNTHLRMSSIVIGLVVGFVVSVMLGRIDFSQISSWGRVHISMPFKYGLDFRWSSFISIALIYLITSIEAYGDITANSMVTGEPIEGEKFTKRAAGGILSDGFNSLLAGALNSFPNSIFAQNNGVIQLTGVGSRHVGYYIAAMLIVLALFPIVGAIFSLIPEPVLGGATLLMFGMVAAAGIRILAGVEMDRGAILVVALSLSLGIGVELVPEILSHFSQPIQDIFSSGITTGGVTAILSNLAINFRR